jgi:hypothetical protein
LRIALIAEGRTERVFRRHLERFLTTRLLGRMPRISPHIYDGRIPTGDKLKRVVDRLLNEADAVVALTDVYTGTREFVDAADAKKKMRQWVGAEPRFHPHAAQYDFEAWLLPYWAEIQRLSGSNRTAPSANPETVNHDKPPAHRIEEVFRTGTAGRSYVKPRDANRILDGKDLAVAAARCGELKAFLNTVLSLCSGELLA